MGSFIANLILASVRMASPLIFLSLAELFSQRAGLVKIGRASCRERV